MTSLAFMVLVDLKKVEDSPIALRTSIHAEKVPSLFYSCFDELHRLSATDELSHACFQNLNFVSTDLAKVDFS